MLRLTGMVVQADGLVIACPEYAHGVPGGLKNALDWLVSGEAAIGKPVMLVHASPRSQISRSALREILKTMSFNFFEGGEVEIALLGKKPADVAAILSQVPTRHLLQAALARFRSLVTND